MAPVRQSERFELFLEVGRLLSSTLDLQELLTIVMQLSARVVDSETASLLLVDPRTDELYFHVALGLDPQLAKIRLKMGEGICGAVAQSGKPLIINDCQNDPRWSSKMDKSSGFVTRSILAAPILLKGRCIGVVEAINHREGDYSEADLRVFEAFASQAGVAIENARLFASLQGEKVKMSLLFNEMRDAALLTDGKGAIVLANAAARRLLGLGAEGGRIEALVEGMTLTPSLAEIIAAEKEVVEFSAVREEPQKLILAGSASYVRDAQAGGVSGRVVVFRDVTDERREEGLKRNFLSLISHKLKPPLASVTGYSQLLLSTFQKRGAAGFETNAAAAIQAQGAKLSSLVDKLLNYTVLEQLDRSSVVVTEFPVADVVQEAVRSLETQTAETKGRIELETEPGLAALGDPLLVRDLVKNLLENGLKFSGGKPPEVRVRCRREGALAAIEVSDRGPGIPPEEVDRVFRKFYQVDASFTGQVDGWGLGLSFVQKVAAALGGTVRLESKVGEGSRFTVSLPAPER